MTDCSYSVASPISGLCKQSAVWISNGKGSTWPLIYLQRPKWITSDSTWAVIVRAVKLEMTAHDCEEIIRSTGND